MISVRDAPRRADRSSALTPTQGAARAATLCARTSSRAALTSRFVCCESGRGLRLTCAAVGERGYQLRLPAPRRDLPAPHRPLGPLRPPRPRSQHDHAGGLRDAATARMLSLPRPLRRTGKRCTRSSRSWARRSRPSRLSSIAGSTASSERAGWRGRARTGRGRASARGKSRRVSVNSKLSPPTPCVLPRCCS
jgi:hypothetical protein